MLINKIVEENNLKIYNLINTEANYTNFIWDNFEITKMQNIELYKLQKQKRHQDLQYLLNYKALGEDPWIRLTSLILTYKSKTFWKININTEKKKLLMYLKNYIKITVIKKKYHILKY